MQGSRGELMEHCGVGAAAVPVSCSEQGALLFCILCAWSFICFGFFFGGGGGMEGKPKAIVPHAVCSGSLPGYGRDIPGSLEKKEFSFLFSDC